MHGHLNVKLTKTCVCKIFHFAEKPGVTVPRWQKKTVLSEGYRENYFTLLFVIGKIYYRRMCFSYYAWSMDQVGLAACVSYIARKSAQLRVCFSDCESCVASMVEKHASMNRCWKSSASGIMKHSEKPLSHFRFIRYKSHMDEEALGQDFLRKHQVFFFPVAACTQILHSCISSPYKRRCMNLTADNVIT